MSPTRKPKPPDKGAPPEHKPSRKVALEEVLRSLQDLVSNELATEPAKLPGEATADASGKSRVADEQPAAPVASPQETETASEEVAPETESITLESLPDLASATPSTLVQRATSSHAIPAGGLQQELPYLDPQLSELSDRQASGVSPVMPTAGDVADTETDTDTDTDIEAKPETSVQGLAMEAQTPPDEINWDDIPVLDEAVDLHEVSVTNETNQAAGVVATTALLPADVARRLAIQVAARLNVELRKSGQAGLSSEIITRLARLLQEALAKSAPNMENTPPDQH